MTAAGAQRGAEQDATQRIVVTGMGAMSPLGRSVADLWGGVAAGRSGIGPITLFPADAYPTRIAGEVPDFDPRQYMDFKEARRVSRASQLAVAAAREALADARLDPATLP